ncbi:uncharacterized protein L3040_002069 [Drepanopeziza brunnea f. sp. 'multigermtubi']|uniref:RRM domain-containing protein n=1 Tax=Marssonina brunnea f. sp. multigermtubi (strain MB_m1) TaxID=1072389 RepID=K1XD06_MARBU|nr:uncharacterized protein MBM_02885 [Drepanopeziza brunnea f. sp. 'multigermtubi' MB_m1]EKD18643.1 hypothetical protein MBM_02885 [Drepanopeziza brunnea f. sp. 'multigermtubi' MB_m1]KAJ5052316.1 hypothetical protein L3040_002069 [Drepanopeziza brunnea f. sp. 'multigermtubi']
MNVSKTNAASDEEAADALFWIAFQDYKHRYAPSPLDGLASDVQQSESDDLRLRTQIQGKELRQEDELYQNSRDSHRAPYTLATNTQVYPQAPLRLIDEFAHTGYHDPLISHTGLPYQPFPDFGPIGSPLKVKPTIHASGSSTSSAASRSLIASLRDGTSALPSGYRGFNFPGEARNLPSRSPPLFLDGYQRVVADGILTDWTSPPMTSHDCAPFQGFTSPDSWSQQQSIIEPSAGPFLRSDATPSFALQEGGISLHPAGSMAVRPPSPRNFKPTNMVAGQNGVNPFAGSSDISLRYRGNITSCVSQKQVALLADAYNCTLWLWNIPSTIHVSELFDQIDTGAVQCLHMVPPDSQHSTAAAKLAFMTPEAAAAFKSKAEQGIYILEFRLFLKYNRDGSLRNNSGQSRVLVLDIVGPGEMTTMAFWYEYFRKICVFQWDRVFELPCQNPHRKILQFNFVRMSGQSQACMGAIRAQEEFVGFVQPSYGLDPCGSRAARALEQHALRLF